MTPIQEGGAHIDMFLEFFSIIAVRPDYTRDWPLYRGYIIESYTSWMGRRDDMLGIIFDEQLFYQHKVANIVPVNIEQLWQPTVASSSTSGRQGGSSGNS